jgi:hypothetical protein
VVCPLVSWSRGTGSLDATVVVRPRAEGVHLAWDDQGPDHVTDQDLPCLGEGTQVAGVPGHVLLDHHPAADSIHHAGEGQPGPVAGVIDDFTWCSRAVFAQQVNQDLAHPLGPGSPKPVQLDVEPTWSADRNVTVVIAGLHQEDANQSASSQSASSNHPGPFRHCQHRHGAHVTTATDQSSPVRHAALDNRYATGRRHGHGHPARAHHAGRAH